MNSRKFFSLFLSSSFLCFVCVSLAFEYPKNGDEEKYIGQLLKGIPKKASPDQVLDLLRDERIKLDVHPGSENERKKALLNQYVELTSINEAKCEIEQASERIFMIKLHEADESGALLSYMEHFSIRQFDLCHQIWDAKLMKAIKSLDERVREHMEGLLDNMMTIKFMKAKKAPERPYTLPELRAVITEPPPAALLLFLNRINAIVDVDENIKNTQFKKSEFDQIYQSYLRSSLCEPICNTLTSPSAIYTYAFDRRLVQRRQMEGKPATTSNYLMEWLGNKVICCAIVRDEKLKENTYKELKDEPVTLHRTVAEDSQELAAFKVYKLLKNSSSV